MSTITSRLRNTLDDARRGRPDATDDDADFCYECDRVTRWDGEVCRGCRRVWGHELERVTRTAQAQFILGLQVAGALAFIGFTAWALLTLGTEPTPVGDPGYTFPACATEDAEGPCYWDAEHRGNGEGRSFIVVDGVVTYLPAEAR